MPRVPRDQSARPWDVRLVVYRKERRTNNLTPIEAPSLGVDSTQSSILPIYLNNISFLIAGAVFYIYLARVLSQEAVGSIVVLSAISGLVSSSCSLSLGSGFKHYISYYLGQGKLGHISSLVRLAYSSSIALVTLGTALALLLSGQLSELLFHSLAYTPMVQVLSIMIGSTIAVSILQNLLLGLQRFIAASVIAIASGVAIYGSAAVLLSVGHSVIFVVIGWAVGSTISAALFGYTVWRVTRVVYASAPASTSPRSSTLFADVVRYSLPILSSSVILTGTIYIDRLILAGISTLSEVGVYNYALLVMGATSTIVAPLSTVLVPKFSSMNGSGAHSSIRETARHSLSIAMLIYAPVALLLASAGPLVLTIIAGPSYVSASGPMALILLLYSVFGLYVVIAAVAAAVRRTLLFTLAASLSLLANIVLSVTLIPHYGMLGAAAGASAVGWVSFAIFYGGMRKSGLVSFDIASLVKIWMSSATMAVIVLAAAYLVRDSVLGAVIGIPIGLAVFVSLLRASRAITMELGEFILSILPRPLGMTSPLIVWLGHGPFPGPRENSGPPLA